jgi:heme A synthase
VSSPSLQTRQRFTRYAWWILAYTLGVIVFGAWVRISGSGAGCGSHWPMCNGQVVPRSPTAKTIVEFTHRLTSGALGPLVLAELVWAWRAVGRRQAIGRLTSLLVVLVTIEGLIGRSLVVQELVADNASVKRAVVVGLHLGNTLLLTGVATACAWLGLGGVWPKFTTSFVGRRWLIVALAGTALVSMLGAVTALGDTLFPVRSAVGAPLLEHLEHDLSPSAHFLVRLRVIHPVLAALSALVMLRVAHVWGNANVRSWLGSLLALLVYGQLALGMLNILLGAPGSAQLLHLLLAQLVWVVLVVMFLDGCSESLASNARERVQSESAAAGPADSLSVETEAAADDEARVLEIGDSIDLHGFAPRDVLDVVGSYLEAAHAKGLVEVRLIHGRGTGFQRARVQELLRLHPLVERFSDAPPTRGGWGATLAWLRSDSDAERRHAP